MKKTRLLALLFILTLCVMAGCGKKKKKSESADPGVTEAVNEYSEYSAYRVSVSGTKFVVDGKQLWLCGINTPWQKWNDFSGNMDVQFWERTFKDLADNHINSTRIWVNCNGLGIVKLDAQGNVTEINSKHFDNLKTLFDLAAKYKIYVMPTLLSFDHFKAGNQGATYWRALINDKEKVAQYCDKYVKEFCKRFSNNPFVFAVDVMNEPDWVNENAECGQISWDNLSYFFGQVAACVHENSKMLVTVGLGMNKYNSDKFEGNKLSDTNLKALTENVNSRLDFYSPHFYMWMKQWFGFPFDGDPANYGIEMDRPVILAETANDDESETGLTNYQKYKALYDNGWAGLMFWTEPKQTNGVWSWYCFDFTAQGANDMYKEIPDLIRPIK
ncbi:MAG: cellulase family glycosylhydrolase [Lachnospiraceae bacterium]|nr:cellulase family glycosylhydrolase [Lachnospiraceae bacterium]